MKPFVHKVKLHHKNVHKLTEEKDEDLTDEQLVKKYKYKLKERELYD